MEPSSLSNSNNETDNPVARHTDREKSTHGVSGYFPAIVSMIAEDGENFFSYLKDLGLSRENDLVVLSSRHHYFYDEDELKNVKTLINLRKLNMITYLEEFLFSLVQILPPNTKFLGCFSDSKPSFKNRSVLHPVRYIRRALSFFVFGNGRMMNKQKVSEILKAYGFQIINMKEMNGLTYFCSQNISKPAQIRA